MAGPDPAILPGITGHPRARLRPDRSGVDGRVRLGHDFDPRLCGTEQKAADSASPHAARAMNRSSTDKLRDTPVPDNIALIAGATGAAASRLTELLAIHAGMAGGGPVPQSAGIAAARRALHPHRLHRSGILPVRRAAGRRGDALRVFRTCPVRRGRRGGRARQRRLAAQYAGRGGHARRCAMCICWKAASGTACIWARC